MIHKSNDGFGITGSVAAIVQSVIGNVHAGSIFAYLQSAGMGGYGAIVIRSAIRLGAGAINVAYWFFGKK